MKPEHQTVISQNLQQFSRITSLITKEWILERIGESNPSSTIIWMLTNTNSIYHKILERLEISLGYINFNSFSEEQIKRIKNSLKSEQEAHVIGVISELDFYALLVEHNISFEYEPKIVGHMSKVDFAIKIDEDAILIEVTALSQSDDKIKFSKTQKQLMDSIKKIELPYSVSFEIKELIPVQEIKKVKAYIRRAMEEGKEGEIHNPFQFFTKIQLKKYPNLNHAVVGTHWFGIEKVTPHIRNLLDRESDQLSINHKNVIIVNLFSYADEHFFYNATEGDLLMNFFVPKNPEVNVPEPYLSRANKNRFLDEKFNRRVNCVIGYNYLLESQKWICEHPNPNKPFTNIEKQRLNELFT